MKVPARLCDEVARIASDLFFRRVAKRIHELAERAGPRALAHSEVISANPRATRRLVKQFAEFSQDKMAPTNRNGAHQW